MHRSTAIYNEGPQGGAKEELSAFKVGACQSCDLPAEPSVATEKGLDLFFVAPHLRRVNLFVQIPCTLLSVIIVYFLRFWVWIKGAPVCFCRFVGSLNDP